MPNLTITKIDVYETKSRFYLVGYNKHNDRFRLLKCDRTALFPPPPNYVNGIYSPNFQESQHIERSLPIIEDPVTYSKEQIQDLLKMIDQGNKGAGGLKKACTAVGMVGFVRFVQGYYLLLITKKRKIGNIAGHSIYGIDDTAFLYLPAQSTSAQFQSTNSFVNVSQLLSDEARYKSLFFGMDLTKDFYFSYTYDVTHNLQYNMRAFHHSQMKSLSQDIQKLDTETTTSAKFNTDFVWNYFLFKELMQKTSPDSPWILPIIHGFFGQANYNIFGKNISICLIARRSRHFAGTRFLKRGINEEGHVANDVETEQIIMHQLVSDPVPNRYHCETINVQQQGNNEQPVHQSINFDERFVDKRYHYSSFTQIRGSIPLYWCQDNSITSPKPPVILQRRDPFYSSTILHFQDLFTRYGDTVVIFNLVKGEEKSPRETILGKEFADAISYLNSMLPKKNQIVYMPFDIRKAHKSKKEDLMTQMDMIAQECIKHVGVFYRGQRPYSNYLREQKYPELAEWSSIAWDQNGVIRTNCIDSLDRTNAAQFCIGKAALGHQLYAMGMTETPFIELDNDIVSLLVEMYEAMGNFLALQYAGSELVNTIKTYRAGNLVSQSRDLFTTVKRYYSNSFTDAEKQHSINLFLGNFVPYLESQPLWDLESDYKLHNKLYRPEHLLFCNSPWWSIPLNVHFKVFQEPCGFKLRAQTKEVNKLEFQIVPRVAQLPSSTSRLEDSVTLPSEIKLDSFFQVSRNATKLDSFDEMLPVMFINQHVAQRNQVPAPGTTDHILRHSSSKQATIKQKSVAVEKESEIQILACNVAFFAEYVELEKIRANSTTNYEKILQSQTEDVHPISKNLDSCLSLSMNSPTETYRSYLASYPDADLLPRAGI